MTIVSLDDSSIYDNHKYLYNECFSKYKNYIILKEGKININNTLYYIKKSFKYPLTIEETNNIRTLIKINNNSEKIEIYYDKDVIGEIKLYKKEVKKKEKSFLQIFSKLFS